jgi:hypothetical protein
VRLPKNLESLKFNSLNKELLYKSDYFSFFSKKKNNKQLLPMMLTVEQMLVTKVFSYAKGEEKIII